MKLIVEYYYYIATTLLLLVTVARHYEQIPTTIVWLVIGLIAIGKFWAESKAQIYVLQAKLARTIAPRY